MRAAISVSSPTIDAVPAAEKHAPVAAPGRMVSQPAVIAGVLCFDALATLGVGVATQGRWYRAFDIWTLVVLAAVPAAVMLIQKARWAYTIPSLSRRAHQIVGAALALFGAMCGLIVAGVIFNTEIAPVRGWAIDWFAGAWALIAASRVGIGQALTVWMREGRMARRTVIVGGGKPTLDLIERLDTSGSNAIQILGIFDDRDKLRSPERVGRYAKLGRFEDLESFCREQRVDLLIIALPTVAEERILHILKMLWVLPIDVRIAALGSKLKLRSRSYNYIGDVPFLPLFDKPMNDGSVALKVIEDRALAALGLLVLSPLLALIALAVKLDSRGPVFFRQARYGFNNEAIGVFKFRSMYVDQCDANANRLVTRGDPRVTRIGAFLRRTSLDELPQLINVLKGELSLVGPRPHAMQAKAEGRIYDQVVEGYFARHKVKPGITGWAQVNGWRGETDTVEKIEQRVAHDLYYIENWSMLLDLRILAMTPLSLVTTRNAF